MIGRNVRILGGLLLAATFVVVAGDPAADAADKKTDKKPYADNKADSTKRPAVGTLAADAKLTALQLAAHVDKLIAKKLKDEQIDASAVCSDEEFLRRVTLDLTGKIPTPAAAVAFLDSKEPKKREKLIDELLASADFGKFQADTWQASLLPRDSDNRRLMQWYPNLTTWLEKQFNDNPGWDKTVKEFMTSTGEVEKNGPVIYWLANNTADKMTDNVTRMFMGIQLQCAQCHNHPFTDYKQNDYWHTAAFFMKVGPEGNPKAAAKNKTTISLSEKGKARKKLANPDAKILPPKFLKETKNVEAKAAEPLRPLFADWMASKSNPYFSKAMVNRTWGHLLGRGIVAPVDDMHDANPASHPELLIDLAAQFIANDFDVKYLMRAICNSQTYQRSSKLKGNNNEAGPELFARAAVRPLTPGQLWDSIQTFTVVAAGKANKQRPADAKRGANNPRQQFIASYGIEDGADPAEYQAGIPQVLRLMNAGQMNGPGSVLKILRENKTDAEAIEKVYLTVLSRRPTTEDVERFNKYAKKSDETRDKKFAGLMWALMNSSEFALNR